MILRIKISSFYMHSITWKQWENDPDDLTATTSALSLRRQISEPAWQSWATAFERSSFLLESQTKSAACPFKCSLNVIPHISKRCVLTIRASTPLVEADTFFFVTFLFCRLSSHQRMAGNNRHDSFKSNKPDRPIGAHFPNVYTVWAYFRAFRLHTMATGMKVCLRPYWFFQGYVKAGTNLTA